jgi:hypothetical protein
MSRESANSRAFGLKNRVIVVFSLLLFLHFNSFAIVEKEGGPWKIKLNSRHEAELNKKYPNGGWFLNLGPTGIRAQIPTAQPTQLVVKFVFQDAKSPARGKIKIGDVIIGANGKDFSKPHVFGRRGDRKGWDGPLMAMAHAIEDSQGKGGALTLKILPGGKGSPKEVVIQLEAKGRFSSTYPYNCPRSEKMAKQICDFIVSEMKTNKMGRIHVKTHSLLALMANGFKEHEGFIKDTMSGFKGKNYDPLSGGFVTWSWGYDGILMGEYSLLYKDKSLQSAMESVANAYNEGSKGTGIFTHRSYRTLDKMGKKPYASIAAISGLAMTALSLIKKAGYKYPETLYDTMHQHFLNAVTDDSAVIAYALVNKAPNKNRKGTEPRHAIIELADASKAKSDKGFGYKCPTGMQNIGKYTIFWPTKADHRWKPTDWIEKESKTNIIIMQDGKKRKVVRNHPDYKEPSNPEPKKPYRTSREAMHVMPVGLAAAAHCLDNEGRKSWEYLGKHYANTSAISYEHSFSGHGGQNLHAFWNVVGAAHADEDKKRKFLDYLKSFLILSETHYGGMIAQPWGRDRHGPNPGYGPHKMPAATAAILLSLAKKRLQITGAYSGAPMVSAKDRRSGKKAESLVSFYSKEHKDRGKLLDFLATKKDEISSQEQLKDTMKFLQSQLRGAHKEKAKEIYSSIMTVVEERVEAVDKLAMVQPVNAFKYYIQFKDIFRTDRAYTASLDGKFKTLFSNRKILELHRLLEATNLAQTKSKLLLVRRSLNSFAIRNYKERELCIEAQLAIEKIDQKVGN